MSFTKFVHSFWNLIPQQRGCFTWKSIRWLPEKTQAELLNALNFLNKNPYKKFLLVKFFLVTYLRYGWRR